MTPDDDDDRDVLKAWRAGVRDMPDAALDGRVLAAARRVQARQRALPVVLATAACLIVAVYAALPQRVPQAPPLPRMVDTSIFGLNEGRRAQFMHDSDITQQIAVHFVPSGK